MLTSRLDAYISNMAIFVLTTTTTTTTRPITLPLAHARGVIISFVYIHTSNVGLRSKVLSDLNASLNQADLTSCSISITTVIEALSHLKLGKSDGTALISNHFICASSVLSAFLSKLFTAMLRHGYVPKSLRDCSYSATYPKAWERLFCIRQLQIYCVST